MPLQRPGPYSRLLQDKVISPDKPFYDDENMPGNTLPYVGPRDYSAMKDYSVGQGNFEHVTPDMRKRITKPSEFQIGGPTYYQPSSGGIPDQGIVVQPPMDQRLQGMFGGMSGMLEAGAQQKVSPAPPPSDIDVWHLPGMFSAVMRKAVSPPRIPADELVQQLGLTPEGS